MTSGSKPRLKTLQRASKKQLPGLHLTERDLRIIQAVYEYRALTTSQIETLFFPGGTPGQRNQCQRRLKKLFHNGYLWRGEQPIKPTEEARKPLVYRIDKGALEILPGLLEVEPEDIDWHPRERTVSDRGLNHLLKTNDVRVALTAAADQHDMLVENWKDERILKREHAHEKVQISGPQGGTYQATIIPDGYFQLAIPDGDNYKRAHQFLEVDLATEVVRATTQARDFARKVKGYIAYYSSGRYKKRYQTKSMRVLTVTTSERRLQSLKSATEEIGGKKIFWFTTFDQITPQTALTEPIWQVASLDEPQPLVW